MRRVEREEAMRVMVEKHYLHRFPTGWTRSYELEGAYITFSIPANRNLAGFLFHDRVEVRELARLWAPHGHPPNLLSRFVALAAREMRGVCAALVSFADPNQGHHGGVYQACSWLYTGQSEEVRAYLMPDGTFRARRAFHSNQRSYKPTLPEVRLAGKHRYVRPLTRRAFRALRVAVRPYPKNESEAT